MVSLNRSEVLDTAPFYRRGVTKELSGMQWKYSNIHYSKDSTATCRTLLRFESGDWAEVNPDLNIMQTGKGKLSQPKTVTLRGSISPSLSPLRRNNSGGWWLAVALGGSHNSERDVFHELSQKFHFTTSLWWCVKTQPTSCRSVQVCQMMHSAQIFLASYVCIFKKYSVWLHLFLYF